MLVCGRWYHENPKFLQKRRYAPAEDIELLTEMREALENFGYVQEQPAYLAASTRRLTSSIIASNSGSPRSESRSLSASAPYHDQPVSRAS